MTNYDLASMQIVDIPFISNLDYSVQSKPLNHA